MMLKGEGLEEGMVVDASAMWMMDNEEEEVDEEGFTYLGCCEQMASGTGMEYVAALGYRRGCHGVQWWRSRVPFE